MNTLFFFVGGGVERGVQEVLYLYLHIYVQLVFNSFDKFCLISGSMYFAAVCVLLLMYLPTGQGAPLGV